MKTCRKFLPIGFQGYKKNIIMWNTIYIHINSLLLLFYKIKQICNSTPKITQQKIPITQRTTIKESLIDYGVENILNNEKEILLIF